MKIPIKMDEQVLKILETQGNTKTIPKYPNHQNVNTVWVVRLKGVIIKHFYSDDIRLWGNPMNGEGWDVNWE